METHTHASEDTHRKIDVLRDVIINGTPAIPALLERTIEYKDCSFRINKAAETPNHRLYLDVTFTKPPADSVQFFITINDPPEINADDEQQNLIQVIYNVLERFT